MLTVPIREPKLGARRKWRRPWSLYLFDVLWAGFVALLAVVCAPYLLVQWVVSRHKPRRPARPAREHPVCRSKPERMARAMRELSRTAGPPKDPEERAKYIEREQRLEQIEQTRALFAQLKEDPVALLAAVERIHADHHNADSWDSLAWARFAVGDGEGGLQARREVLRLAEAEGGLDYGIPRAHVALAIDLLRLGRRDEAVSELVGVIESTVEEGAFFVGSAYLLLGNIAHDEGDPTNARQAWEMAGRWDHYGVLAKELAKRLGPASSKEGGPALPTNQP